MKLPTENENGIRLMRAELEDLGEIDIVFDDLTAYSERINGMPRSQNAAYEFVTAKPPTSTTSAKHAFIVKEGKATVGLLHIMSDYPCQGTSFIGLLAVRETMQGAGFGRSLCRVAELFAREELHAVTLRLAVVETNPVLGFWIKMGFRPTGEIKPFKGDAIESKSIIMEKAL